MLLHDVRLLLDPVPPGRRRIALAVAAFADLERTGALTRIADLRIPSETADPRARELRIALTQTDGPKTAELWVLDIAGPTLEDAVLDVLSADGILDRRVEPGLWGDRDIGAPRPGLREAALERVRVAATSPTPAPGDDAAGILLGVGLLEEIGVTARAEAVDRWAESPLATLARRATLARDEVVFSITL